MIVSSFVQQPPRLQLPLKKIGTPWQQGAIRDLNNMYEQASKVWRCERGLSVGNLRTEVPGTGIAVIIDRAVAAVQTSRQHKGDADDVVHTQVCWYAAFLTILLFWFRADTIAGYQPGDISFNEAGAMNFLALIRSRCTASLSRGKANSHSGATQLRPRNSSIRT